MIIMAEGHEGDGAVGTHNEENDDNDSLQLLFRKLTAQRASDEAPSSVAAVSSPPPPSPPYILLIQHRYTNSHVRWVAATEVTSSSSSGGKRESSGRAGPTVVGRTGLAGGEEASVYWRAGLRTPAECARRDWEGPLEWLYGITERLCHEFESVLYVRTLTKRPPHWLPPARATMEEVGGVSSLSDWRRNLLVVDAATDPFGWNTALKTMDAVNRNDDVHSTATTTRRQPNLESLDELFEHLQSTATQEKESQHERQHGGRTPLVLQSLAPLLHRHGFSRTLHFLQTLAGAFCPLVVPVEAYALTTAEHRVLEGLSQALLCLDGGDAVLVRRGVRERDNVVRESLDFEIVVRGTPTTAATGSANRSFTSATTSATTSTRLPQCRIRLLRPPRLDGTGGDVVTDRTQSSRPPPTPEVETIGGRRPVALELTIDDAPRTSTASSTHVAAPRIFVEDDDPEYHDYDEEDPDDDLDL